MKRYIFSGYTAVLFSMLLLLSQYAEAQRMPHRGGGRGGARPAVGGGRTFGGAPQQFNRPQRSINGGSQRNTRNFERPSTPTRDVQRPASGGNRNDRKAPTRETARDRQTKDRAPGNRVDVDKGRNNININVDNSKHVNIRNNRHTVVRPNPRPYVRPPYRYGGFHFYAYHPYYYHPYRPFYWGPVWHPWGFFVATMATTAIIVSVESQQYQYDQGVYYQEHDNGYQVVEAPVGATVKMIPEGSEKVVVNEKTYYYFGGTYYEKTDAGYTVVPPTAGTIVANLPEGGEEVKMGDVTYVKLGETYYQPIEQEGKNAYEVVEVKEAEEG
jgi:hypothetical protein